MDTDATQGTVTITGLPDDLTGFNGGTYTPGSTPGTGTWTGSETAFNALAFTAGAPGNFDVAVTATTSLGNEQTTQDYELIVNPVQPVLAGAGLAGDIVTNFTTLILPSSSAQTPDATFTATDINYGGPGLFPGSVAQFLDANGQTDGNTVSDAAVAGTGFENIYLDMNGYILLTGGTTYTFATVSDDGSILSIGGHQIVDNNEIQGPMQETGTFTATTTGYYQIEIQYFQGGGGASLVAEYSTDGGNTYTDLTSAVLAQTPFLGVTGGTVHMNVSDNVASSTVTITGLPDDLSSFNGGAYTPGSSPDTGSWTGTGTQFNDLSFTAGAAGSYELTISASSGGASPLTATASETLLVDPLLTGAGLAGESSPTSAV